MVHTDNTLLEIGSIFARKKESSATYFYYPTGKSGLLLQFGRLVVYVFSEVLSAHHLLCSYAFASFRPLQLFLTAYWSGHCKGNISLLSFCVTTLNYVCKITPPIAVYCYSMLRDGITLLAQKCNTYSSTYKCKL
jgi:hypothetical protein